MRIGAVNLQAVENDGLDPAGLHRPPFLYPLGARHSRAHLVVVPHGQPHPVDRLDVRFAGPDPHRGPLVDSRSAALDPGCEPDWRLVGVLGSYTFRRPRHGPVSSPPGSGRSLDLASRVYPRFCSTADQPVGHGGGAERKYRPRHARGMGRDLQLLLAILAIYYSRYIGSTLGREQSFAVHVSAATG